LAAANSSIEQIRQFIDADTLAYLSNDGLFQAVQSDANEFCAACFDGHYPTKLFGLDQ
jgi:amidophosphoribosyltransferase